MLRKILSATLLALMISAFPSETRAQSNRDLICSRAKLDQAVARSEAHSDYDKNKHCSVSCQLTLSCPAPEVMLVGYFKELRDLFGPGKAELKDIQANRMGISFAQSKRARNVRECFEQCDLYFTRPI